MKRILLCFAVAWMTGSATAQEQELTFKVIRQNPITSVKNQNRSGTCWDYATCGFFEGEILRKSGKAYDLSEMFVASKDYVDCAEFHVRMHGYSRFSEGGSCDDVLEVIRTHGICPEEAMPVSRLASGDSLANFNEFFSLLEPYVEAVAQNKAKDISLQWKEGLLGILNAYLGPCPTEFEYEGKRYTPQSFATSLGLDWDDYKSYTSFTHHPFYTSFVIEAPYKWRPRLSYNVPLDELMAIIDGALEQGYNVAWGGDVSEEGFTRNGLATTDEVPSQELRQRRFDTWKSTYDHVMLIFGQAEDQHGQKYYMVKNSWGETGNYQGIWYMSRDFIALNTTYVFLNKNAIKQ